MRITTGLLLTGLVLAQGAHAQNTPTFGGYSYHEMRTLSGLGGGSFGTDAQGNFSLSGPLAFSTPVANTLGRNHIWLGGSEYSYKEHPVFNTRDSNSGYAAMVGATLGNRINLSLAANFIDTRATTLIDVQAQWIPAPKEKFTYAVGIADLLDRTKSTNNTGGRISSFSPFAVTTYQTHLGRYAAHLTAGTGSRRFAPFFGSATLQVARPLRVWSEEDRFGNVTGLTYTAQFGRAPHPVPFTVSFGLANWKYTVLQAGLGF